MWARAGYRVAQLVVVFAVVSCVTFAILHALPGDAAEIRAGPLPGLTPQQRAQVVERIRKQLGLDKSLPEQYGRWVWAFLRGDFGDTVTGQPVSQVLAQRATPTIELMVSSFLVSIILSVVLALLAYGARHRMIGQVADGIATLLLVFPAFWFAFLLVVAFAVQLKILPASGYVPFSENPVEHFRRLVLPCLSLSLGYTAIYFRYLYAGLQDARRSPFATAARAKGIPERAVAYRHVLPNAILPFVTVVGLFIGSLIGSTVIDEQIFGWPGLGQLLVLSVNARDVNTLVAIVMITSFVYATSSVVVDLAYNFLDPRMRRT